LAFNDLWLTAGTERALNPVTLNSASD